MSAAPDSSSSPSTRNGTRAKGRFRHSILFIVLVAFLLRLAVITIGHTYRITPRRDHFQYGWEMGRLARSIASGQGFSSPTDVPTGPSAWAAPMYPYILAGVFKVFGIYTAASAWIMLTFNSVFSALTCLTLYWIGKRLYGVAIGRIAAWTWALYPYAIYWSTRAVWETALTTFMLSLALAATLLLAEKPRRWGLWILFGLLWGLIMLTNTAVVSMMPCCLLWLLFREPKKPQVVGAALCVLMALLVVTPWLARNYVIFGKFVFVRDNLALEMHEANNASSQGLWTRNEHPGNDPEAMRDFQQAGEMRFMEEKKAQVRQFISEHPWQFLGFTLKRALYFWIAPPQPTMIGNYDMVLLRMLNFASCAVFAFAGLWLTLRNHIRGGFLLACFLLIYPLPYYIVNPFVRYKHPIEPVMILLIVYVLNEAREVQIEWPKRKAV